jgi:hypothetical protein
MQLLALHGHQARRGNQAAVLCRRPPGNPLPDQAPAPQRPPTLDRRDAAGPEPAQGQHHDPSSPDDPSATCPADPETNLRPVETASPRRPRRTVAPIRAAQSLQRTVVRERHSAAGGRGPIRHHLLRSDGVHGRENRPLTPYGDEPKAAVRLVMYRGLTRMVEQRGWPAPTSAAAHRPLRRRRADCRCMLMPTRPRSIRSRRHARTLTDESSPAQLHRETWRRA